MTSEDFRAIFGHLTLAGSTDGLVESQDLLAPPGTVPQPLAEVVGDLCEIPMDGIPLDKFTQVYPSCALPGPHPTVAVI